MDSEKNFGIAKIVSGAGGVFGPTSSAGYWMLKSPGD
jgi:hypothetical protein